VKCTPSTPNAGIQSVHGCGRPEEDQDYMRSCFTDEPTASDFKARFGSKRMIAGQSEIEPMLLDDPIALTEWAKRNIQRE
jgi:hypothetical protein